MSRRRRSSSTEVDSLELGLDMVCNAFGGIIFITLLIAILPHGAPPAPPQPSVPAPEKLIERSDLAARLDAASKSVDSLSSSVEAFAVVDNTADVRAALKRQLDAVQGSLKNLTDTTDELRRKLEHEQHLLDQRRSVEHTLIGMTDELRKKKPAVITEARLPDIRRAAKRNVFIVLKGNRVYIPMIVVNNEQRVNRGDFDVTVAPGIIGKFVPRPDKGENYKSFIDGSSAFVQLQHLYPNESFLINLIVYPDAIEAFNPVRNAFTSKGYQHYWSGIAEGQYLELFKTEDTTAPAL